MRETNTDTEAYLQQMAKVKFESVPFCLPVISLDLLLILKEKYFSSTVLSERKVNYATKLLEIIHCLVKSSRANSCCYGHLNHPIGLCFSYLELH